jgi:hypothetical protein
VRHVPGGSLLRHCGPGCDHGGLRQGALVFVAPYSLGPSLLSMGVFVCMCLNRGWQGSYSASGASWCTDCASGRYTATTGQTSCNACAAGHYSAAEASSCAACAVGQVRASAAGALVGWVGVGFWVRRLNALSLHNKTKSSDLALPVGRLGTVRSLRGRQRV